MSGARLDSEFVRRALGLTRSGGSGRAYASVCADSRQAAPGALFAALPGERTHGVEHLADAAARGAVGAIVPIGHEIPALDLEWFAVQDPVRALGDLAAAWRAAARARVVGITGSSGKTTVKEMLAAALSVGRSVHATRGNLNSLVGLPLTILEAPPEADVWVLELGANAPGEIARLAEIAAPRDAVVTTVSRAHLERFGSVENVLREKLDLIRGADPSGVVVVGERPSDLVRAAREIRPDTVVAGIEEEADYRPERASWDADRAEFERGGVEYAVSVGGEHHLRDALIAAAVAEGIGLPPREIAGGLATFKPLGWRGALRRMNGLTVVADCYNANPESFEAAIAYCVSAFPDRRLAAAVGTMLELGSASDEAHREVAGRLLETGFGPIVATGEFVGAFERLASAGVTGPNFAGGASAPAGPVVAAADADEAGRILSDLLRGDEVVLVKGSRGVHMEQAVDRLAGVFDGEPLAAVAGGRGAGAGPDEPAEGPLRAFGGERR
ncbi:MAG: UDP-N-acetylmuramoyl-tripeptide--D-alanyl-D-alanine ligase [Candidatus Palauibacterales bacterium]|nr:UDP-N-acetylmuramoyl-tripeptide--D-alanyl-D-alanine ligase [Candidatus Palauibacterales bacterium]MDP2530791.1 UDP-N-acetylmuramoyl-tripeptide--D-alanyl-D-alanine ligase [Candidatus Palauibacterales bacterium]MDP2583135.1 UDP-N-acetylmuramoyl-tripeptide--D-alanyl-D-alanine ligase [Candidatus Palauibacterales bacterium]